jgi:hypothetical protein
MSLVSSCGSGSEEDIDVPTGVLNEETFTKVLVDFSLAESASNLNVKNVSGEKMDSTYAFDPLKENKISKAEYDSAISFYSKHPALYKKVYENVLTTLSKLQIKKDTSVKVDPALK